MMPLTKSNTHSMKFCFPVGRFLRLRVHIKAMIKTKIRSQKRKVIETEAKLADTIKRLQREKCELERLKSQLADLQAKLSYCEPNIR